jgi:nuclear pore complex protein Nup205
MTNLTTDRHSLLQLFEARMLLLLQISRTRDGAAALLDAGIVSAARDSLLFRADPDLGISLPTPVPTNINTHQANNTYMSPSITSSALSTYYTLLSCTLRLLLSTFSNRGTQNEQVQFATRQFLADYRTNMVGVFKRFRGVNGKITDRKLAECVAECVRAYTGLCALGGFVEIEGGRMDDGGISQGFS